MQIPVKLLKKNACTSQLISLQIISFSLFPKKKICLLSFIGISISSIVKFSQILLNIGLYVLNILILFSIILLVITFPKIELISSVKLFVIFKLFFSKQSLQFLLILIDLFSYKSYISK